ncbi:hypothetical protein GCM10010910_03800 [Microbacterium nanhaiense]|uniref:ParB-like N-terminal domain-containing protein n=1 Tax=Microbacterium nanhaiense TaxID=1301026 RepID=A0ABQ2MW12_9MICO|nr:ParB N-terminal domain-containing protein [Microbacterium nanhaiense]GGO59847.1 hypothetical protein GCM10010910_03800 [Microbacterium nanhaiense]
MTGLMQERTLDSIHVGNRHRTDLGDIDELAKSIDEQGLLQPITVTPEGVLICGARRLAAMLLLGWRKTPVWVRGGISTDLDRLLAEQDDVKMHKNYSPVEAAALYDEVKELMAEDSRRRNEATRFSETNQPGADGGAKFAPPSAGATGKTRAQAAAMIPGGASYATLDKINHIQAIARDEEQSAELRALAAEALVQIRDSKPVHPLYAQVCAAEETLRDERVENLHALAEAAKARVLAAKGRKPPTKPAVVDDSPWATRAFTVIWHDIDRWWVHFDPETLAAEVSDEYADLFLAVVDRTIEFAERFRAAREALQTAPEPPTT